MEAAGAAETPTHEGGDDTGTGGATPSYSPRYSGKRRESYMLCAQWMSRRLTPSRSSSSAGVSRWFGVNDRRRSSDDGDAAADDAAAAADDDDNDDDDDDDDDDEDRDDHDDHDDDDEDDDDDDDDRKMFVTFSYF